MDPDPILGTLDATTTFGVNNTPTGMFLEGGRQPEIPEETHTNMGRTCIETPLGNPSSGSNCGPWSSEATLSYQFYQHYSINIIYAVLGFLYLVFSSKFDFGFEQELLVHHYQNISFQQNRLTGLHR